MKAIQKELGEMDDAPNEIDELQNRIDEAKMSDEAIEKANAELNKLKMMSPMSAEASVVRATLSGWWVFLGQSAARLSTISSGSDHPRSGSLRTGRGKRPYLEYLAVQKRVRNLKAQCFVSLDRPG